MTVRDRNYSGVVPFLQVHSHALIPCSLGRPRMDATKTYPTPDVKAQLVDCWRAYRLAELEGRTDTAAAIMKRINALLECLPR